MTIVGLQPEGRTGGREEIAASNGPHIIVLGAGASGMTAALAAASHGARVTLLEKGDKVGGTAAVSGGIVWAPSNHHLDPAEPDNRHDALAYFDALGCDPQRRDVLEGFVDNAADAITFIEQVTPVRFAPLPGYPDYYTDRPGARLQGGRALDSGLFGFGALGEWRDRVVTADVYPLALSETPLGGCTTALAPEIIGARIAKDERGFGQALVGGLLAACLAHDIAIRRETEVTAIRVSDGRVAGLTLREGEEMAADAVIVATGGFEWNVELARAFLRGPIAFPASPPGNRGEGLTLLMAAGAALGNMTSAWWCPTIVSGQTWDNGEPRAVPVLIERTLPGSIIVNREGHRFCNEAVNYSAIEGAFHAFDPNSYSYTNMPAWLVFDHRYKLQWPVASAPPGEAVPDWMVSASSAEELGRKLGVDGTTLATTIARFNADASNGIDPEFDRGLSSYDRFYGDRTRDGALATLGPLDTAPFYAVEMHMGVLGTNGGAKTDHVGRVVGHDGATIPGLYAVGNVMAGPTGGVYAGAGGTLGPALTYGFLAGRHAARGTN